MMGKTAAAQQIHLFDVELVDLQEAMRWREWMGRIKAAIFASTEPVPRAALSPLVGQTCVLDDLIADSQDELKARPYELVFVVGGWAHRRRPRFAELIRAASTVREPGPPDLSKTETMVLPVVGYYQPVTRARVSAVRPEANECRGHQNRAFAANSITPTVSRAGKSDPRVCWS